MKRSDCTDPFLRGYLDAALWTTDETPGSGDYVETGRADEMFPSLPADFIAEASRDCLAFETRCMDLLDRARHEYDATFERHGVDFWLTRNGHGAGFWDRGYADEIGDGLTAAAEAFGEVYLDLEPQTEETE